MMKNKLVLIVIGAALLGSLLACQAGALLATPTPVPTDTPVPTATPLPTDTPVPTDTPIPPTDTLVPTDTPEPTETPEPPEKSDSEDAGSEGGETALEELSGGAQKFTDIAGGYAIIFPEKWLVMDASEGNLGAMVDVMAESNPDLAEILEASTSMVAAGSRFFAVYANTDFVSGTSVPVAYTILDKTTASFPLDTLVELNAKMLPEMLDQVEILESGMDENANGVEYGYIKLILNVNDANGDPIRIYEHMVFYQTDDSTVMTVLAVTAEFQEALGGMFDGIIDTIEVMD
ncbi:MAG: hypothetical protein ACOYYS_25620 [Chloroflexota bacterium]